MAAGGITPDPDGAGRVFLTQCIFCTFRHSLPTLCVLFAENFLTIMVTARGSKCHTWWKISRLCCLSNRGEKLFYFLDFVVDKPSRGGR
jgi:hypothetical protein